MTSIQCPVCHIMQLKDATGTRILCGPSLKGGTSARTGRDSDGVLRLAMALRGGGEAHSDYQTSYAYTAPSAHLRLGYMYRAQHG